MVFKMYLKRIAAAVLCAVMLIPALAGCSGGGTETTAETTDVLSSDTELSGSETAQTDPLTGTEPVTKPIETETEPETEPEPSSKDPGYVIPEEELSGKNESAEPLEDDGNGEAIFERLKKGDYFKNPDAKVAENVDRASFAYDIIFLSGFSAQQGIYICENVYSDMDAYSADMRHAEIAVNQGFMLRPADTEFRPYEPVTYGEVLRGLLYALGYREYADKYGVAKLAAETGLSNYLDLSKKNSDTLTYAEYAQLYSNALRMKLVVCVKKDGVLSIAKRGENYDLETTYIKNKPDEADSLFRISNSGWDIYDPGVGKVGYRYGPSFIINEDGTIDCWLASDAEVNGEIDWGKYRRSYDNGFTWTPDTGAVRPTSAAEDWNWSCDPGVIKIGDYYYAVYTTILWHDGVDNNLFVARSKTPQGAFVEKWCGDGWSGDPKPIVTYDGVKTSWGCGEGSMVVVGNTLYLYVSWNDNTGNYTRVYTADAKNENWPETLKFRGTTYKHSTNEDSADVKYIDAYDCFISVATAARFSDSCYIHVMTSYDGIYFRNEASLRHTKTSNIMTCIHNMGITGDALGHIDIFNTQQYVGYAYQPNGYKWASWKTRLSPISFIGTENYDNPENVISRDEKDKKVTDTKNTQSVMQIRIAANNGTRTIKATAKDKAYKFIVSTMSKSGTSKEASKSVLADIEYIYDPEKVSVDKANCTVTLLCDEVVRVYAKYKDLMCEFAVTPGFLDQSKPVAFYPETDTVTFYYRNEYKQPSFIAKSATNDYLMLWRGKSSFTDTKSNDIPEALKSWDRKCEYSGYDESIIKIDSSGKITPLAVGETTITATYMGFEATMKVVVAKLK